MDGDARISIATRRKVLECVSRLGYRVNSVARSLKISRTFTIRFITPEIANDFFMLIAHGAENALRAHGYNLMICNSNENPVEEAERVDLMLEKCVDGLTIVPSSSEGRHLLPLQEQGIPVVLVDRKVRDFHTDMVLVDNSGGTREAVSRLIQGGFRSFEFNGGNLTLSPARERYDGFIRAIHGAGLAVPKERILFGDFHEQSGYELFGRHCRLSEVPRVVFVSNYYMHVGAARYIAEHPEVAQLGVKIAGFDTMSLSAVTGYSLVTISQPIREIGERAAELLVARLSGSDNPAFPHSVRLPTRVVVHSATGAPGARAPAPDGESADGANTPGPAGSHRRPAGSQPRPEGSRPETAVSVCAD